MIHKSKVILRNPFMNIIVVDYNGVMIQMAHSTTEDYVYVQLDRNGYSIVSEDAYQKSLSKLKRKPKIINENVTDTK